jgi:hypothetical protein
MIEFSALSPSAEQRKGVERAGFLCEVPPVGLALNFPGRKPPRSAQSAEEARRIWQAQEPDWMRRMAQGRMLQPPPGDRPMGVPFGRKPLARSQEELGEKRPLMLASIRLS